MYKKYTSHALICGDSGIVALESVAIGFVVELCESVL